MSFFVDRLVEFPGRIKLTDTTTGNEQVVDVERQEGDIIEPGTLLNAANMNYGTTLGQVQYDPNSAVGTTDGDLHAQLDPLGWETDVMDGPLLNVKKLFTKMLNWIANQGASVTGATSYGTQTNITPSRSGWLVARGTTKNGQTIQPVIRIKQGSVILSEGIGTTVSGTLLQTGCPVRKGETYIVEIYRANYTNATLY